MAITLADLKKRLDELKLKYFLSPDKPMVMAGFGGLNGSYQVALLVELEGTFLQFRSLGYLKCPADRPEVMEVLKVIGDLNYRKRLIKFGWDASDGEIVAYADMWIMDGGLTTQQLDRMLKTFVTTMDIAHGRLKKTMETGADPGDMSLADMMAAAAGGLPKEIADVLKRMGKGKGKEKEKEPVII